MNKQRRNKLEDLVQYKKEGDSIGRIILNRANKHNSLDFLTMTQLIEKFTLSRKNEDKCVVFTAKGKDFTVGDDLKYTYNLLNDINNFPEAIKFIKKFQDVTRVMLNHPGVLIAGLHGHVIGGGFEMLLSCDLRIAATDTKIILPELGVGLFFSNASTKLLPQIIGMGKAKELMFLGEEISAEEAYRLNLVNKICKPQSLERILKKTANIIIQKGTISLKIAKKLLNENFDKSIEGVLDSEEGALITAGESEEAKKRIGFFVKK
ncbi:MAG: hypothetical protein GF383_10580 [Candidatus Lokiarchaeota archaeon]|nr:hypothetical protein [Candidatus Lokiarchaeota archaeon]MBD3341018.1 hypothetical protein [Candidatus Lokiarchaeota archaeon]